MTFLVLGTCAVAVGFWSWGLHEVFGWPVVAMVAACGHLWVLVFSPHRWDRHISAMFLWGVVAAWLWLPPPPWHMAMMLAFPVGIQSALLILWVASEVPHRWRLRRSGLATLQGRCDAEQAAPPDRGGD